MKQKLIEAALDWGEQYNKMKELENGTRGFNAKSASDAKLTFNQKVCIKSGFYRALKIVEDEMIRRGLISGYTQTSTSAQPQQTATQNTSTTNTTQQQSKPSIDLATAPLSSIPRSTSVDWSDWSIVEVQKKTDTFTKELFNVVKGTDYAKDIINFCMCQPVNSIGFIFSALIFAIVLGKSKDVQDELKRFLVVNIDLPLFEIKRLITEVRNSPEIMAKIDEFLNNTTESLNKAKIVEDLEKTTPYMLRNDGAFLECGDIHPYIKMQYKQSFDETYKALLNNYEFLDWFYYNTTSDEVKELICKFLTLCEQTQNIIDLKDKLGITNSLILGNDTLEKVLNKLNDLTNQEFCRARTSNFKYKYGGDNGEIYFRISSKNFNWFDLIWQVVSDYSVSIKFVTIMKDYAATGERFKYLSYKGKEFNKMPINEFLALSGNPVVESLNESESKQDTLNPKLWDGMELKPEVKEKIDMIVNEFLETLNQDDIDNIKVSDVILVGSNVSYNYTSNSDIDIHIRIDLSIYDKPEQRNIMSRLVSAYAKVWNNKYTISFYGIPVELFIETKFDVDEDWQLL